MIRVASVVLLMVCVAGCSSGTVTASPAVSPSATSSASVLPTEAGEVVCVPNDFDACVGPLAAGTHRSILFHPTVTFEVPDGWANHADSTGEYVLYAPGSQPNASEFGARDWIAFEANVTSTPAGCGPDPTFDESESAAQIAEWMAGRAGLVTTSPQPVNVGGLEGQVLDVRLADDAPVECFPVAAVLLVHGIGASEGYDQAILAGTAMRFYLFDLGEDVLMIEIDDVSGGDRLDEFSAVVDSVQFTQ